MTIYRVTDAWVEQPAGGNTYSVDMDFHDIVDGSAPLQVTADVLAVINLMMAFRSPVYYDIERKLLSTDPKFGEAGQTALTQPLLVEDFDAIWNFSQNSGSLFLTMQNRSVVRFDVPSASDLVAWALAIQVENVRFDGNALTTVRDIGSNP